MTGCTYIVRGVRDGGEVARFDWYAHVEDAAALPQAALPWVRGPVILAELLTWLRRADIGEQPYAPRWEWERVRGVAFEAPIDTAWYVERAPCKACYVDSAKGGFTP